MAHKTSKKRKNTSLITKLKNKIGWLYYLFIIIYYLFYYLFYVIHLIFKWIITAFVWMFNFFSETTDKTIKYTEKRKIEKGRDIERNQKREMKEYMKI